MHNQFTHSFYYLPFIKWKSILSPQISDIPNYPDIPSTEWSPYQCYYHVTVEILPGFQKFCHSFIQRGVAVVCWCRGAVSAWAYHLSSWGYLRGICRRENVVPSLDSWAMVISWSILPILQYYLIERWPFLEFWGLRFFFGFTLFTINLIVFLFFFCIT